MRAAREPIHGLDLVRLAAALGVVIYHFAYKGWATAGDTLLKFSGRTPSLPAWWPLSWWGWIGVQVFFVLSGLVIAYSAEGVGALAFARKRFLRLFPAALICASVAFVVAIGIFGMPLGRAAERWLHMILFLPFGPWMVGQFWTLPIEVGFYALVWALILAGRAERFEGFAWGLGLVSAAYWLGVGGFGLEDPFERPTQLLLLQHGCYFALGVLLARADRTGFVPRDAVLTAVCLFAAVFQIRAAAAAEVEAQGLAHVWPAALLIWAGSVFAIFASLRWKAGIGKLLSPHGRTIRLLGLATYPLYLVHMHVGGPVLGLLERAGAPAPWAILAAVAASLGAALAIAQWAEPPLHRWIAGLLEAGGRSALLRSRASAPSSPP